MPSSRPFAFCLLAVFAASTRLAAQGQPLAPQDNPPQETFGAVPEPAIDGTLPQPRREAEREAGQETPADAPAAQPESSNPAWWQEIQRGLADTPAAGTESAATPLEAPAQDGIFRQLARTASWLCFLCGVIVLGGYLLRRYGKNTPLLAGVQYGTVLGKIHLSPRASLHYVQSGGRILVIGLTQGHMSLIAEFEPGAFESAEEMSEPETRPGAGGSFADELRAAATPKPAAAEDDELAVLRGDVQRLQRYLQDNLRESVE